VSLVKKNVPTYEITLRRDVQQVTRVRVQASSPKVALDVAMSTIDDDAWNFEQCIGTHKPSIKKVSR
jgi:hypothetical protein